jgi:hypothetical protein
MFGFRLVEGALVCSGQRVTTDTATRETVGEPMPFTDQELREGVEWPLQEGRLYNLLLLCVPPGSAMTGRVTIGGEEFVDQCVVGSNGRVGPWLVFVAPATAPENEEEVADQGGEE